MIAGSFFAGVHFFVIDLPAQQDLQAPRNERSMVWLECLNQCIPAGNSCGFCDNVCRKSVPVP
ncbi:MAG: hypothetical protein M0R30_04320 [Methanoregula sp.]|uniref:hypothetical protein n=1 Tax=Methanoregula sp. TaxID=2052170 RepID=UPI0025E72094|nr:hypothetical protein [Methanoregula sp.]MCK9630844.1 hypothetical protein [Methanoregula sp.]